MKRTIRIKLKGRKSPIILAGYLVFDGVEPYVGFSREVYGLDRKGNQFHFDFDDIVSMKAIKTK